MNRSARDPVAIGPEGDDRNRTGGTFRSSLPQSERAFQTAVVDYARRTGWRVAHHHDSRRQVRPGVMVGDGDAAGLPDLIMVRQGRVVFAELKAAKGRLSSAQCDWLEALGEAEGVEVYLWRPENWASVEGVLR